MNNMSPMEREQKKKRLEPMVGEYVQIFLRNTTIIDVGESVAEAAIGSGIEGFIIDVDKYYIYTGPAPDQPNVMIDIEEVGLIRAVEYIPPEFEKTDGRMH